MRTIHEYEPQDIDFNDEVQAATTAGSLIPPGDRPATDLARFIPASVA